MQYSTWLPYHVQYITSYSTTGSTHGSCAMNMPNSTLVVHAGRAACSTSGSTICITPGSTPDRPTAPSLLPPTHPTAPHMLLLCLPASSLHMAARLPGCPPSCLPPPCIWLPQGGFTRPWSRVLGQLSSEPCSDPNVIESTSNMTCEPMNPLMAHDSWLMTTPHDYYPP